MTNALLLSPAYGWFIGLLVVMIVVTGLFALILFIALRPIKKDVSVEDVSYAKSLLGRREAELTVEIMKNKGNVEVMDSIMAKLREVAAAEKLIDELAYSEETTPKKAPAKAPKAAAKPQAKPQSKTFGAGAKPQSAEAKPAQPVQEKTGKAPESRSETENK